VEPIVFLPLLEVMMVFEPSGVFEALTLLYVIVTPPS